MYKKFNRAIKYNRQLPNQVSSSQKLSMWQSLALSFQPHPCTMAPTKKGGEKKGRPAINGVTKEYTINVHKLILGVRFKRCAPRALREI